jgi:hypothetical protein
MNLYQKIKNKKEKISVVGLGYVGMPLAIAFAKKNQHTACVKSCRNKMELFKFYTRLSRRTLYRSRSSLLYIQSWVLA